MAKFFQRLGFKKENFLITMEILNLKVPVKSKAESVTVEWIRGAKHDVSKSQVNLDPENPEASFTDVFKKLSIFYRDEKTNKYF